MAREFTVWLAIILVLIAIIAGLIAVRFKARPVSETTVASPTPTVPIKHEEQYNYQ